MNKRLLPTGKHYGLTIHSPRLRATGSFSGGGHKLIWHTTESDEGHGVDNMATFLRNIHAEPHVVIDPRTGHTVQLIAFDNYAPTLKHPPGTPETNRANCIQVEVCGRALETDDWPDSYYKRLAALAVLIEHRRPVPRKAPRAFGLHVARLSGYGFVTAKGHFGHEHVPNNDHYDPGALRIGTLLRLMSKYDTTPNS